MISLTLTILGLIAVLILVIFSTSFALIKTIAIIFNIILVIIVFLIMYLGLNAIGG